VPPAPTSVTQMAITALIARNNPGAISTFVHPALRISVMVVRKAPTMSCQDSETSTMSDIDTGETTHFEEEEMWSFDGRMEALRAQGGLLQWEEDHIYYINGIQRASLCRATSLGESSYKRQNINQIGVLAIRSACQVASRWSNLSGSSPELLSTLMSQLDFAGLEEGGTFCVPSRIG